ncbi:arginine--tRNA ligase [Candidatus Woesearchaeota archaeon CG10_big_fil_rev_8_21_14_0_10_30_7]|nr:MAG: arginine--tRNA ligase [Candidatus Woesearchaeota archaeon CG10_big_fil_rev_8_21_14_0_10_30_7]
MQKVLYYLLIHTNRMFKKELEKLLKLETGEDLILAIPPNSEMGDFALACFSLTKKLSKPPVEIAKDIVKKFEKPSFIKKIEVQGAYLNFFLNKEKFADKAIKKILSEKEYGCSFSGKNKNALIEHTSINPNASPHVGRARNAIIGDCLARLLKFEKYKTEVHYFVNDIGKQIAMLVLACMRKSKVPTFDGLLKYYVGINEELKLDPKIEEEVFVLLNLLEKGDEKIRKKFREVVEVCIKGQSKILADLGINYDVFDYESDYLFNQQTSEILIALNHSGKLYKDEENCHLLNLEGFNIPLKSPVLVLTRNDGTSLYPLRDLAYTKYKMSEGSDKNIVVLGEDQKVYMQQIIAGMKIMNLSSPQSIHYSFVLIKDVGKMSTRKGQVVLLEKFMEEASKKASKEIQKRRSDFSDSEIEKLSKIVGYGAVKFSFLKVSNDKNITFDWESALSFEGDTGPYCQYTHARICSILAKEPASSGDYTVLIEPQEFALIKLLLNFPEIVKNSLDNLQPHLITNYLIELCRSFNEFYHSCPVLQANNDVKPARLVLIDCVRKVLSTGLYLIGVEAPEKM